MVSVTSDKEWEFYYILAKYGLTLVAIAGCCYTAYKIALLFA